MNYQSEAQLEDELLHLLTEQNFTKINITNTDDLLYNFRQQINKLNTNALKGNNLSDKEFDRLLTQINGKSVYQSAKILRDKLILTRDDNSQIYLELLNTKNYKQNIFQIANQITVKEKYTNRYDVTILINGLPLVQIELKRRGNDLKEAFNQIERYRKHSYSGLFRFVQIFVISNGVDTKYFTNSDTKPLYTFTFFWTDEHNRRITKLSDFTKVFFNSSHLLDMLADYMIINDTDKNLMIMRPYQVYATKALIKQALTTDKGGYIWHTTGSGKTLTSFKCSQILSHNSNIKKIFFVVDRSDLDRQTLQEFNKFEKNSVDATDNTNVLARQIADEHKNLIVTTIQKLSKASSLPKYKSIFAKYADDKIVIIFDECHRSTFGKQLNCIKKVFPHLQIFGFTGTPRFPQNKSQDGRTTADIFGKCLHTYLIKDAIFDHNVLGFNVEYIKTFDGEYDPTDTTKVQDIDKQEVFDDPVRLKLIAEHIVKYHDIKTHNRKYNALFAVSSVDNLIRYYDIFKSLKTDLKIAAIFTYGVNEEAEFKDEHSRDALERIIQDYNKMYQTNYDTNTFSAYANDLMKKIKTSQVDIVIVVGMMLTGFDAKVLNTLYIDKNLEYHNLLQAYSRTNRVEHSTKPFGNIVCYRNLKENTDNAIKLFSQTDSIDEVLSQNLDFYLVKLKQAITDLLQITPTAESVDNLQTEEQQRDFILAFRKVSQLLNILNNFTEFDFNKYITAINTQDFMDYKSKYLTIYEQLKNHTETNKVSILNDIDFCIELVATDRINTTYIMNLIHNIERNDIIKQQMEINQIKAELKNSDDIQLRFKIDLIEKFLDKVVPKLDADTSIDDAYNNFVQKERTAEITAFAKEHDINADFLQNEISDYEYTGIISKAKIMQTIKKSFLEKAKIATLAVNFIKNNVQKYL
ncbi:type I restriction endonuclease subunit R [Megamonas hypermegale]|uniref:type I restriction endonuclease subunit R n=1 Tax=Megamonas hypermegale TaxID=158847 RepID=UPI0025A31531|nr:type I restriction endonuclease subunit R [Megamonas hypermegale]MDM8144268.1 type I restriction endonuclease subunit R [Megamonas hypermegale]